jgi:hypothetical protein
MNPNRDHLVAARVLLAQARRLINDASRAQLDAHRHVLSLGAGQDQRDRMAHASSLVLELVRELDAALPDERAQHPAAPTGATYCRARYHSYVCELARDHAGKHAALSAMGRERITWNDERVAHVLQLLEGEPETKQ